MAIFVLKMKSFSRSAGSRGSRATSAAAYRAGERIRDLRTGAIYDHRRRQDVLHREIVLPRALERGGGELRWARERASLWNAAEHAEPRRNSRVAREFMVALPHELQHGERLRLARGFARALVERYNNAVDLVIHAPRGDQRNFHAHLLATTREVTGEGLGRKTSLEWSGTERHRHGLLRWSEERTWLRERWAGLTNEALKGAHLDQRVSHEVGARDPTRALRLPAMAYYIERRGGHSVVAERIRERHRAALEQPLTLSRASKAHEPPGMAGGSQRMAWLKRVRDQAQATWLSLRQRLSTQRQASRGRAASEVAHTAGSVPGAQSAVARRTWERQSAQSLDAAAPESLRRWREYRAQVAANPDFERQQREAHAKSRAASHGPDLDLGL